MNIIIFLIIVTLYGELNSQEQLNSSEFNEKFGDLTSSEFFKDSSNKRGTKIKSAATKQFDFEKHFKIENIISTSNPSKSSDSIDYDYSDYKLPRKFTYPVEKILKLLQLENLESRFESSNLLYRLLDIAPTANFEDIKKAYKAKALDLHPGKIVVLFLS